MAIKTKPTKVKSILVPVGEFPIEEAWEAVRRRDGDHVEANVAVKELLEANPELLAKYGLTVDSYKRPGQTMSGLRKRINKLVESDPAWWDKVNAAGIEQDKPRPGSTTKPAMPSLPSIPAGNRPQEESSTTDSIKAVSEMLAEYLPTEAEEAPDGK